MRIVCDHDWVRLSPDLDFRETTVRLLSVSAIGTKDIENYKHLDRVPFGRANEVEKAPPKECHLQI